MMPNQTTTRILLYKYSDFILPVGVLVSCALIMFFILLPQISGILAQNNTVLLQRQEITALEQNLSVIESYDSSQTQLDLTRVNAAIPESKDFGTVINALEHAATIANITLSDYSFQVGNLSSTIDPTGTTGTFQVNISLQGNTTSVITFLHAITHQLPLTGIVDVKGTGENTVMTLVFYYQPQAQIHVQATDTFTPLSPAEQSVLSTLAAYDTGK